MIEAQAQERQLPFHTMGWLQFQRLCSTILVSELGQTIEEWEPGRDGGRDAAFYGLWTPKPGQVLAGAFVFQIKYSRDPDANLTLPSLRSDIDKAVKLRTGGKCDHYMVITNMRVSGQSALSLERALESEIGCQTVSIFGNSWLTRVVIESSHLRMLVPRVYGLGDLGEIIDTRGYEQFRSIMLSQRNRMKVFVPTKATSQASKVLTENGLVLLVGDPMTGKSTIASALTLQAMDHLEMRVLKIRTAEEFIQHWNAAGDARQFFWVDDAFGETIYDRSLTRGWSRILDAVRAAIETNRAKIIMTTRTYIWRSAKTDLKTYAYPALNTNQVVIQVADLTLEQKQEILYNHVRLGNQPSEYRTRLKPHLPAAAAVVEFLPEIARRLGDRFFTSALPLPSRDGVIKFFERPTEVLNNIITGLSADSKAALAILFANSGRIEFPLAIDAQQEIIITMFGSNPASVISAFHELDETLILRTADLEGNTYYAFAHPSIQDALAQLTGERPEWLDIYLAGASRASILRETNAGGAETAGVKVIIPSSRFALFSKWLSDNRAKFRTGTYYVSDTVEYYLAHRCGAAFLSYCLEDRRELFDPSQFSEAYSSGDDDFLAIGCRLYELNILPDEIRQAVLERMHSYAKVSLAFLESDPISSILSSAERNAILEIAASDVEAALADIRYELKSEYSKEYGTPQDHFAKFYNYADELLRLFPDDENIKSIVESQQQDAADDVTELEADNPDPDEPDYDDDRVFVAETHEERDEYRDRDVFSDVADAN